MPTKDQVIGFALAGPEPQSIQDWIDRADATGGRCAIGRNHWETVVEYRVGFRWDPVLGVWYQE